MKAILKEDMIVKLSIDRGVDVGNIPNGVALDRLRWNGSRLVDLGVIELGQTMYVRHLGNNFFELHIVPLPGTYEVYMNYKQRKDLRYDPIQDRIYLAGDVVKAEEAKQEAVNFAKAKIKKEIGKDVDIFMKHFALTAALIVYASQRPQRLKDFFDDLAPHIIDAFPVDRWEEILRNFAVEIKKHLEAYYQELDK